MDVSESSESVQAHLSEWVYKLKKNPLGEVVMHKVRLVAKRYITKDLELTKMRYLLSLLVLNQFES